jgi:dolichol-phosphate mannosyltransferase
MSSGIHISVVTPAYKCAECIVEMHRRLTQVLSKITPDYEIIFVDDRSPQNDWEIISEICAKDTRVRGVQLSRNFGQHFAITAGLDHARGEWIVVMDCDLQDKPEEIAKLYAKAQEGHDVVFARRCERNDSLYRKLVSNGFRLIYNWLGDIDFDNSIANFSICSRRVIESVCSFRERNRSFPVFILEVGFRRTTVDVEHAARFAGFFLAMLSVLYGSFILVRYFTHDVAVEGWTTLAVLTSLLGGLGFANLGIVGLYLGKVFDEVKLRPLYFVQTSLNDPPDAAPAMIAASSARIHA